MSQHFNKSFESLYNIAMKTADECIVAKSMEKRFEKLEEEYQEVIEAFANIQNQTPSRVVNNVKYYNGEESKELLNNLHGELSDMLFVLLHIAHLNGESAFSLLHKATAKMLSRMNDPDYKAKN
jgi:NTP pyrophosphatase (non-canonical NTP hydrolase)